jgi:hypothetical protein
MSAFGNGAGIGQPLSVVLQAVEGCKPTANGWEGRCPAHDDRRASLSISQGEDGRVLLRCHAGCATEDIVASMGLTMSDLFEDTRHVNGPAVPTPRPRIDVTYDYQDEQGSTLYQVLRYTPKDFKQRKPDGNGGWVWRLGDVRRVPYRLRELLAAPANALVFVPEGERDVNTLANLGLVATCNPGGAGKWHREYNAPLRGRHVVVIPDNDLPGREHAAQVAALLKDVAATVVVLDLPDLPDKGDVTDWLRAGGTTEELLALVEVARQKKDKPAEPLIQVAPGTTWPEPPAAAAFHGLAGRIAKAIEPHTEADPIAVLIQVLVAFGNAAGRGPHFQVESSRHYANMNVVLVGQTSKGRKGTSWDHVAWLLRDVDPGWASKCVTDGLSTGEGLIHAVRDPVYKKEPIKEKGRVVDYQDVLADQGVSDKRLLAMQPEFVHVLKTATRDGNTLSPTIRQAWDGGNLNVRTKNNPAKATDAHISMIGHITRDELLRHLGQTEAANGFANRFLWICVRRAKPLPEGGGFREVDVRGFVRELAEALKFARQHGDAPVARNQEARELWRDEYPRLSAGGRGMAGAILGRAEAQAVRLSLLYALLDQSNVIRADHLRAALAMSGYAERSALHIFGDSTGDRVADEILRQLSATPTGLTQNDLINRFGRHLGADRLGAAFATLTRDDLVYSQTDSPSVGRPAKRWFASGARGERGEMTHFRQGTSLANLASLARRGEDGAENCPERSTGEEA